MLRNFHTRFSSNGNLKGKNIILHLRHNSNHRISLVSIASRIYTHSVSLFYSIRDILRTRFQDATTWLKKPTERKGEASFELE